MDTKIITTTDGSGYWSDCRKTVTIIKIGLGYINDEGDFGELCAYFDNKDWNPNADGLIYTDHQWMEDFRAGLKKLGFTDAAVMDISYSEQGMQGFDYVSMDVEKKFLDCWNERIQQTA